MAKAVGETVAVARILYNRAGCNIHVRSSAIRLERIGGGRLRVEHNSPHFKFLGVELGIQRFPGPIRLRRVNEETTTDIGRVPKKMSSAQS